jgi:hypothetical protein
MELDSSTMICDVANSWQLSPFYEISTLGQTDVAGVLFVGQTVLGAPLALQRDLGLLNTRKERILV